MVPRAKMVGQMGQGWPDLRGASQEENAGASFKNG